MELERKLYDKLPSVKNGCRYHDDCFSCPFDDCRLYESGNKKSTTEKQMKLNAKRRKYYQAHKEEVNAYQKSYYAKNKKTERSMHEQG